MKYNVGDYVFETNSEYNISIAQGEFNSLGTVVDIRINFGTAIHPETVKICWQTLSGGIYTLWRGMGMQHRRIHPNWGKLSIESRAASDIPIMSYIGKDGSNKV